MHCESDQRLSQTQVLKLQLKPNGSSKEIG